MRVADLTQTNPRLARLAAHEAGKSAARLFVMGTTLAAMGSGLGGCTTLPAKTDTPVAIASLSDVPPVAVEEPAPQVVPTPRPKRPAREARANTDLYALRKKLVIIKPDQLIGLEPSAVEKLLGAPASVKNDDFSREWVYAASGCSFRVFFYPNVKTDSFLALKYGSDDGNGELMDTSDVCIRNILTAKNNAAE